MFVEQLIRETLEMQGFCFESVKKAGSELVVTLVPDLRYHPRCGVRNSPGDYRGTAKGRAPQATLIFDKFHIVNQLTEAVDKVRRQEVAEKKQEHKGVLAGTRYIWLKNPWNLTDKQKASLSFLETLNLKIHRAYLLKESFRDFWQSTTRDAATKFMAHWFGQAMESKIKPI